MKKIISALMLIIIVASTAQAQDAGQIWIGGSMGFSSNKTTDLNRLYNYKVLPEIGYVLSENLGIGLSLGYAHQESDYGYYSTQDYLKYTVQKQNGFTVNPFVRYSFLKGDVGSMFVDGGVAYTYSKNKIDEKDDMSSGYYNYNNSKTNELEVGFRPGVALKISDKVVLTAKYGFIGYQYKKEKWSDYDHSGYGDYQAIGQKDVETNTFSLDFDFRQAMFGVNFIF